MAVCGPSFNLSAQRSWCQARRLLRTMADLRYCIGVDENGLGPRLGPMIVTAVMAEASADGRRLLERKPRGGLARRLGDSKGLVAHGDVALAEAWARVLVGRGAGHNSRGLSPAELVEAISLDGEAALRAPCPDHVAPQCWNTDGEGFEEGVNDDLLKQLNRDLDRLQARGVRVVAVRSVIVCTRLLNDAVEAGRSRFVVDLHAMERLVLALRELAGKEVQAICGKVGGFGAYGKVFGPLAGRLHAVVEEGRARSTYRFPGVGELSFVRDGDSSHLLVGMASLVGKYLRELLMDRIVRHYRQDLPELPTASGYHDPVTKGFVVATESVRRRRRIPDDCFERTKIG